VALIAIAADKGAPGVTTTTMALTAVWPRPILLAECDPSGGDLVYRFAANDGGHLDPRRGLLSLAIAARRGMPPRQAWEHVQKMQGGMDLLAGVTNSEQGTGLNALWGSVGRLLAGLPQADVIADCGRLGVDGPAYDLLAEATLVVLVSRAGIADVIRLRDRAAALTAAMEHRRRGTRVGVLVVTDQKNIGAALGDVQHVLDQAQVPAKVIGGVPDDPRSAQLFRDGQIGKLNKTPLVRAVRGIAKQIVSGLPEQPEQPQRAQPEQPSQQPPHQLQPRAQPWDTNTNPPGVLVASHQGRHGKASQDTAPYRVRPEQPPPGLAPVQQAPVQQSLVQQSLVQQAPAPVQPLLRPVPVREQSGGG
jgi:hypothetical protein